MVSYKGRPIKIYDYTPKELEDDFVIVLDDMMDSTSIKVLAISGFTIDPFTQQHTATVNPTWIQASGVIGTVTEEDALFGYETTEGKIRVGDLKVTYPFHIVSGILGYDIEQIQLNSSMSSGVYRVVGRVIDVIGNVPLFVDFALMD